MLMKAITYRFYYSWWCVFNSVFRHRKLLNGYLETVNIIYWWLRNCLNRFCYIKLVIITVQVYFTGFFPQAF